jgi:hypothetical protein
MTDDMLADAKKVLDDQTSTTSSIKEAKEKLEKGFEELAKLAAQAGGGATDPTAAAAAQSQSSDDNKSKEDDIVDADFEVVEDENDDKEKS